MRTSYGVALVGDCHTQRLAYITPLSLFEDNTRETMRRILRRVKDGGNPVRPRITKRTEPWTEYQRRIGLDLDAGALGQLSWQFP